MRNTHLRRRLRQSRLAKIVLLLASLAGAEVSRPKSAPAAEHAHESLPDFDRRKELAPAAVPRANAVAVERINAEAALRNRLPDVGIERHPILGSPKWLSTREGFLTGRDGAGRAMSGAAAPKRAFAPEDSHRVVKSFVEEHAGVFGHDAAVLEAATAERDYTTAHNGLRTTLWRQKHEGIEVFDAVFLAHTTKEGELVNVASQFVPDVAQAAARGQAQRKAANAAAPGISAAAAIRLAAEHLGEDFGADESAAALDEAAGPERKQRFQGAFLKGEASARLVWLPEDADTLRLCWRVILKPRSQGARYRVLLDADTGEIWKRTCMTTDLSDASYRVFTGDSPTPLSPGRNTPGNTNQPTLVARSLQTLSALNTTASPNGWIDDGVNETRGNNVDGHADADGDDSPDLPRPQGSPNRVFDFALDFTQNPSTHHDASVVNLFYWCNWAHDKLYDLGFTEGAGNFQNNNFGRGGVGGDAVRAQAQDGEGVNNANFSYTDADGEVCDVQMFLWNDATPDRDGSFDTEIVLHEYAHGLSQRLVGGGVGLDEDQSQGMGEGWSDFYAIALLSQFGDDIHANYAAGAYVLYDYLADSGAYPRFRENYYFGIRRYPYTTDLSKNPLTFKDIDSAQADPHTGVPKSQRRGFSGGSEVHDQGEVWCAALWDARANLIAKYGFATGNQRILQLVTDGMKLSPPNPNVLQARDAIIQADQVLTGGANRIELWRAFAKRGMGYYATSPASSTTTGVVENFDEYSGMRIFAGPFLVARGPQGGPFDVTSFLLVLSNGSAASLNWTLRPEPPLEASLLSGTLAAGATRSVTVSLDANAAATMPAGVYSFQAAFSNQTDHAVVSRNVLLLIGLPNTPVEEFTGNGDNFDLSFRQLTFTPDETGGYSVCRGSANLYPVSPATASGFTTEDDEESVVALTGGKKVPFFGEDYSQVYVNPNGHLTFAPNAGSVGGTLSDHFAQARVAVLYDDLVPAGSNSRISWQQLPDRFVVTWERLRDFTFARTNHFQVELLFDGVIRMTFLDCDNQDAVTGLSRGGGMPIFLNQTDLSAVDSCSAQRLTLFLPKNATEGALLPRNAASVSIPSPRLGPTLVNLSSSDTTELTVDASVIIPAGGTNAAFDITVVNDFVRDGSQLAYVTATALNYGDAVARLRVDDNENNPLSLSVPLLASESQGDFVGTITVPNPVSGVVTVNLSASRTNEITVPAVAFIPAGQTSAVFTATVIDDRRIDGNLGTTLTATVPNWTSGSDTINIFDNEDHLLRMFGPFFILEGSGTLTNAGNVFLSGTLETNLTVSLGTANFFELLPLGPVTIPAGQTNAHFSIGVGDNTVIDGVRQVALTASATGFTNAIFAPFIFDNDQPPEPANPYPPHGATNWMLNTHLSWDAAEGELLLNGNFETGDLTGWTLGGYGGGGFVLNDGTFDPESPDSALLALGGSFSALAVQFGNGKHTLSQEFFIPDGATSVTLTWRDQLRNHAGVFAANQRFAVELRRAEDNALFATLFSTQPGDAPFSDPTNRTANLKPWRGERVRLVFVEEDGLGHFNVHLDDVSVTAGSAATTTFDVYFGNDASPDETDYVGSTTNHVWSLPMLAGGLNYYWRIDSRRLGITNAGPVWQFRTGGSSLATTPLTYGSVWKYIATGVNLGTAWRATHYADTLWPSGTAPLGFGSSQVTTIGQTADDYITFYFRRRLTLADTNRLATVTAFLKRDDGAIVYVNGVEAVRDNMPAGRFDYLTEASTIVSGADETNAVSHAIDPRLFIEGTNIIAVEVHQRRNGFPLPGPSPDLFFDLALSTRTNSGNLAPTFVNWILPADFSVASASNNLGFRVGVVDDNLLGARVAFFADGALLSEDFITPFTATWTNPPMGAHTFLAVATDAGGLSLTSAPLHVLVAPAVTGQSFITLVPPGDTWRYRDNGHDPGTGWTTTRYREANDRSWASGPAQLGYGDGDEATVLDVEPDRFIKPVTAYFRRQFTNQIDAASATLRVLRDDGVVVHLNGSEIFRNNLPLGSIRSNTLASASLTGTDENTWLEVNVTPALLNAGANLVAAEVHQSSVSSPDLSFDLELSAAGNVMPSVALTAPANGSVFLAPPTVLLSATASDSYGSVTQVQFLRNGTPLGTDSVPPYEFSWSNPPSGTHTLTAIATDNLGATKASTAIQVTVVPSVLLSIESSAGQTALWWPDTAAGYRLEATTNLASPVFWQLITNAVIQTNGQFRVPIEALESQQFFRLRAP